MEPQIAGGILLAIFYISMASLALWLLVWLLIQAVEWLSGSRFRWWLFVVSLMGAIAVGLAILFPRAVATVFGVSIVFVIRITWEMIKDWRSERALNQQKPSWFAKNRIWTIEWWMRPWREENQ